MAKDPAFLFYSSDFLSGVTDLTMEERGQYITLLSIQHQKGHLTEKMIKIAVGNATADVMAKFRQDEKGYYFNERLEVERNKRLQHSEKQRQRAIKGWEKRKSGEATADATALPLENEDENRNEIKDINKNLSEARIEEIPDKNKPYFKATYSFWELFKSNIEEKGASTVQLEKAPIEWIDSVRLLQEKDGYKEEDLRDVFKLLQVDEFWKCNILSVTTLRKQFSKLIMKARKNETNKGHNTQGCSWERLAEITSKNFGSDAP